MALTTNIQIKQILSLYESNKCNNKIKLNDFQILIYSRLKIKISIPTISRIINGPEKIKNLPDNNSKKIKNSSKQEFEEFLFNKFVEMRKNGFIFTDKGLTSLAVKLSPKFNIKNFKFSMS